MSKYDLEFLKEKGFFREMVKDEIDGKIITLDPKNSIVYIEVEDNSQIEKFKKRILEKFERINYMWFWNPNDIKLKVFRRVGEIKWFWFSPTRERKETKKSKEEKLEKLSPGNINILFDTRDIVNRFYNGLLNIVIKMARSIKDLKEDSNRLLAAQRFVDRLIFFYFVSQLGLIKIRSNSDEIKLTKEKTKEFTEYVVRSLKNDDKIRKFFNNVFFNVLSKVNETGWASHAFTIRGYSFEVIGPALNGGLFEEDCFEGKREMEIRIEHIGELIRFLNQYNWIVGDEIPEEDRIGDLTPEVIGHIYEKLVVSLEQIEETQKKIKLDELSTTKEGLRAGRKKIGAYYTPEEITNYISENTIIPFIKDKLEEKFGKRGRELLEEKSKRYIFDEKNKKYPPEDLKMIKYLYFEILTKIKICDNACGSGSFLLAAGSILLRLYNRVLKILEENLLEDKDVKEVLEKIRSSPSRDYYIVREIIVNNLYGVDIMRGAVEIARLRLWLWLISQVKPEEIEGKKLETLPNLDFNIMEGNSLIGFVDIEDIDFSKLLRESRGITKALYEFKNFENLKTKNKTIEWLKSLAKEKRRFKTLPAHEALKLKEKLKKELDKARELLNEKFYNMLKAKGIKISKGELLKLKPFHWGFEFYEVFDLEKPKERRGFDVIIGNPPYGNILSNLEKNIVKVIYPFKVALTEKDLKGSHNSAAIFIERSYLIMNSNGKFGFIVPNTIARKDEFQKLRWFILNQTYCYELADVGNPFKYSGVNLEMIIIFYGHTRPERDYRIKILSKRFERPKYTKILKSKFERIGWFALYYDGIFEFMYEKIPKIGRSCNFEDVPRPYQLNVKLLKARGDVPVVKGNALRRYYYEIKYWIDKGRKVEEYLRKLKYPLLVIPRLGGHIKAAMLINALPISTLRIVKVVNSKINPKYLLIILNSKLIEKFFLRYIFNYSLLTVDLDESYLRKMPFIIQDNQQPFITLADYMLFLNATEERRAKEKELIDFIDKQLIDSLVYELYFKEKFYEGKIYEKNDYILLKLIEPHLKPINYDRWSELYWKKQLEGKISKNEEKELRTLEKRNLEIIKEVVKNIRTDKGIMVLVEKIKSHPWVRTIEGGQSEWGVKIHR